MVETWSYRSHILANVALPMFSELVYANDGERGKVHESIWIFT